MMSKWPPIPLDTIKSYPLKERINKVTIEDFCRAWKPGGTVKQWLRTLPRILAGNDLAEVVDRFVRAASSGRTIILAMGAHPIKVGLNPIILDLLNRRIISGVALNGAGIIHDAELAMAGGTSEDVSTEIGSGRFGMARETGSFLNAAIAEGAKKNMGLGRSVGAMLVQKNFPYNQYSLLARAYELDIPVTVHVAIGTDIIHCHPSVDGPSIGVTSHLDFRIFARLVSTLEKGVFINLGSAVILPEVFLKALSLVRNLGYAVSDFTTVNMDFFQHYRPMTNVVRRPTLEGGKGYSLVGHHEIMFPLLAAAIIEELSEISENRTSGSDLT
jgi:deoxyhypusine synthase